MQPLKAVPDTPVTSKEPLEGRTYTEIIKDLKKELPEKMLETKKQGGATLTFIPWHGVVRILDYYAPGWEGEVKNIATTADRIFVTYTVTIHASDRSVTREATGTELLKEPVPKNPTLMRELAYGDPSSNAESMAFRRAAAKHGLGLYLYYAN
jgi:hypothetical protein